jgi:hypothetical protein
MRYEHACSFCGWRRPSATLVMLSPLCDRCGCALESVAVTPDPLAPHLQAEFALPPGVRRWLRAARAVFGALVLYGSTKVGYDHGGASGGMVALGFGGFMLLPFVPERLGGHTAASG